METKPESNLNPEETNSIQEQNSQPSAEMVETVFGLLKSTLESGEKVKIAGFGNFVVKQKADRRGRNPQTGETITINARRILTFKPSQVLKSAINAEVD